MKAQIKLENIDRATCVVKDTHKGKGRFITVKPGETASRNLFYGRIILEAGDAPIAFANEDHETGLICLNGAGNVDDRRSNICDEALRRAVCSARFTD